MRTSIQVRVPFGQSALERCLAQVAAERQWVLQVARMLPQVQFPQRHVSRFELV